MHYRLSLLSTQSAQPLLRSDNLDSSQLLDSRKDTRSVSCYVNLAQDTTVPFDISYILNKSNLFYKKNDL